MCGIKLSVPSSTILMTFYYKWHQHSIPFVCYKHTGSVPLINLSFRLRGGFQDTVSIMRVSKWWASSEPHRKWRFHVRVRKAAKTLELALTMTCSCLKLSSDNREALRAGVAVFEREGTFVVVVPKIKPSSALSLSYSLGGTGLLAPPAM